MVPVARDRSVLLAESGEFMAASAMVNYEAVPVRCTRGICCLYSISARTDDVRARIIGTSSRSVILPNHTRILVRSLYMMSDYQNDLWAVSDPYFKRVDACTTHDLVRVVTFSDDDDFNRSTTQLTELEFLDGYAKNFLLKQTEKTCGARYFNSPLFFFKEFNKPLPKYYYRRNTVWDKICAVEPSRLQDVVTMQSDRQCGVFMDGIVVMIPERSLLA